jgi:4-amino-4-deoxy-L-arabinose transferase-like glycosyltransferase
MTIIINKIKQLPDILLLTLLCFILLPLRAVLMYAGGFDLHFDEAQYWEWSQRLDWSYYSKGPLIAWLIAASTFLFGHGEWQVRLPAWLSFDILLILLFYFTHSVWQTRTAAWCATGLLLTTPIYFGLGQVMTTDVLLFACWTAALWAAYQALIRQQPNAWYGFGAAIGIGALTKLSIGLLPFFLILFMLFTPQWRREFYRPFFWLGLGVMLCLMSPLLIWNLQHDFPMFRHDLGHLGTPDIHRGNFTEFLLSQWVMLSPVTAILAVMTLWKMPSSSGQRLLWGLSLAVFGFFTIKATIGEVQSNWAAPLYFGWLVLFAGKIQNLPRYQRYSVYGGMNLSVLLMLIILFPQHLGLPKDPLFKFKQWRHPIQQLAAQVKDAQFILTTHYGLAGELAFYWQPHLPVYLAGDKTRRFTQYDLWKMVQQEVGKTGIVVLGEDKQQQKDDGKPLNSWELPSILRQAFAHCEPLKSVVAKSVNQRIIRVLHGWRCENLQAIQWEIPGYY